MLLEGKKIADELQMDIAKEIANFSGRKPSLAVILIGNNPASKVYVGRKIASCETIGIISIKKELPESTSEQQLLNEILLLNNDPTVDGILVQLPLPSHIKPELTTAAISPDKDIDGFHPINVGKLLTGDPSGFTPCTPLGIQVLLKKYHIETRGKHVVIVGRSNIVGKPMAALMIQNNPYGDATVTIVHRHTTNLSHHTSEADILIVAIGKPKMIHAKMIKEGAVIIDVGINQVDDPSLPGRKRLIGDVDFHDVKDKCSYITPVPGGVGPMTIAMLLHNTLLSYKRREHLI